MKIKLYPNEIVPGSYWDERTWYLEILTKKEHFWLISYHVNSLIIGILFFLTLIFFKEISGIGIIEGVKNIYTTTIEPVTSFYVIVYIIWLLCSFSELATYIDEYEFSENNWRTWGRLEMVIRLAVRMIRGLPIMILGAGIMAGIGYGLFYLSSLLINLL